MEAEELSALLNEYLTEMTKIATKYGGTIDKFIGDAVMIFFGAPESAGEKEDALRCVRMAMEMQARMKELQAKWFRQGIERPLQIRIGINTGVATVGDFGAEERLVLHHHRRAGKPGVAAGEHYASRAASSSAMPPGRW